MMPSSTGEMPLPDSAPEQTAPAAEGSPTAVAKKETKQIAKRGSRACNACRKGKNRCVTENGQAPCKRCVSVGIHCVFESASGKGATFDDERMERIERSLFMLQSTVQSLVNLNAKNMEVPPPHNPVTSLSPYSRMAPLPASSPRRFPHTSPAYTVAAHDPYSSYETPTGMPPSFARSPILPRPPEGSGVVHKPAALSLPALNSKLSEHPPLPNYRAPPHPVSQYGIIASTAPSSDEEDAIPTSALTAPFEALAEAAAKAREERLAGMPLSGPGMPESPLVKDEYSGTALADSVLGVSAGPADGAPPSADGPPAKRPRHDPANPAPRAAPGPAHRPAHMPSPGTQPSHLSPFHPPGPPPVYYAGSPERTAPGLPPGPPPGPASASPSTSASATTPRAPGRRRRHRAPPPPNAFPDVVTKKLVPDHVARILFDAYFAHCQQFFPIFDPARDTYASLRQRTPWSVDAILGVAGSRSSAQDVPLATPQLYEATLHATEEAQGISRSSLFGPTVRNEGVQAMAVVAAWSEDGYLAAGHALRMALELGLDRALGKLCGGPRDDERDLVVSARIYLCLYVLDYSLSAGSGRPFAGDAGRVTPAAIDAFVGNACSIPSDLCVGAQVAMITIRSSIEAFMRDAERASATSERPTDSDYLNFATRARADLEAWFTFWDERLAAHFAPPSFERVRLRCQLYVGRIYLGTAILKSRHLTSLSEPAVDSTQAKIRHLAVETRDTCLAYVNLCLSSDALRGSFRYATASTFVDVSFSALLLLKLSRHLAQRSPVDPAAVGACFRLQDLLKDLSAAQRFALTIRIALERFSKKYGVTLEPYERASRPPSQAGTQRVVVPHANGHGENLLYSSHTRYQNLLNTYYPAAHPDSTAGAPPKAVPSKTSVFSPSDIPAYAAPSPFDLSALASTPAEPSSVLGHDAFPEWLSNESEWTFGDLDPSRGPEQLFLPLWSTQWDSMFD